MKNVLLTSLGIAALISTSCDKADVTPNNPVNENTSTAVEQVQTKDPGSGMSLAEFTASRETQYEIDFLKNTPVTNNTDFWQNDVVAHAKPVFKWHGFGPGHGCNTPLGICLIIGISDDSNPDLMTIPVGVDGDKLTLHFIAGSTENFGVTTDGYMPILFNVDLPDELINDLGTDFTKVRCGIYKANYNADLNQYVGVVLDLI